MLEGTIFEMLYFNIFLDIIMLVPYVGIEEVTKDKANFVKQLLAEFIGTLLLVKEKYKI